MNNPILPIPTPLAKVDLNEIRSNAPQPAPTPEQLAKTKKTKELFNRWVGMTFYGQLISTMRKSVGKSNYFHGGRGEEVFQGQLDLQLAESMADASAESFSGPLYELAMLGPPR